MMMFTPERHLPTSGQHGPAPSGTPPPAYRRPHHRRHGKHSPTARQPYSNGLCSPPRAHITQMRSCYTEGPNKDLPSAKKAFQAPKKAFQLPKKAFQVPKKAFQLPK